jgi:uncharacterized protein YbjT (DUF2867 family)
MSRTALVFGGTGLVGKQLVDQLVMDERFLKIRVFNRREVTYSNEKIDSYKVDLSDISSFKQLVSGDVLFCCLGTTIKKAGNRQNFSKIDKDLPISLASVAFDNGVDHFMVISSIGANAKSSNFYLRTKGLMEHGIRSYRFQRITIVRPSLLLGKREEFRAMERLAAQILGWTSFLFIGLLRKYKPIKAENVALAMVAMAGMDHTRRVFETPQIFEIANQVNNDKR